MLDLSFDASKLDDVEQEKYRQALRVLAIPITEGSPVSWDDRHATASFAAAMNRAGKRAVLQNEVSKIAADAGISEKAALQLASACNSRTLALMNPSYLVNLLIKNSEDIVTDSFETEGGNGHREEFPINLEYVQRYLRAAHIVGVKQDITSATLGKKTTSVSFFDLEKTATEKSLEQERRNTWQRLGGVATALSKVMRPEINQKQPLLKLLENVYAKPEKLVEAAMAVDGYEEIFNADAGNWEGFTFAEHTETVLRNFDETYAEKVPVELLAPMRLAIIAHDLGKPIAAARGEKHRQKEYNIAQASDFFEKLGVDERVRGLLRSIIGEGVGLAFQIDIRNAGEPAQKAMRKLAIDTLRTFNGSDEVTEAQINGFTEMCKMLQICDGGAYTSMAVTRRKGAGRHRNADSFNGSFSQPVGFGKRTLRLRNGGKPADSDLTPIAATTRSRVRINTGNVGSKAPRFVS